MMEAASISATLVNYYHGTWRYNPENSHLHNHRRENLKLYHSHSVPLSQAQLTTEITSF
jgi:hypothetical protein